MKVFLASFFLLIFSFQVLPVKEIGKLLFKQTLTEEIHETENDEASTGCVAEKDNEPYTHPKHTLIHDKWLAIYYDGLTGHLPSHVSKQYIPDIPTPPPNMA